MELVQVREVIPFVKPETDRITRLERELATIKATMVHAVKKGKTKRVAGARIFASAFFDRGGSERYLHVESSGQVRYGRQGRKKPPAQRAGACFIS